jgi:hypothetical protein
MPLNSSVGWKRIASKGENPGRVEGVDPEEVHVRLAVARELRELGPLPRLDVEDAVVEARGR